MDSVEARRKAEKERLQKLTPLDVDPDDSIHGVLLSDQITFFVTKHHLIDPFDPHKLKPAAYELTVGDYYFQAGRFKPLDALRHKEVEIPPFEVIVLNTTETICLPVFMIARWNIKVGLAYKGLLWVGGPQVDAGFVGKLACPIYNLSDRPVTLKYGEPIAVIDFVKTTPFDAKKCLRYPHPPTRVILEDYAIDDLRSALFTEVGQKIGGMNLAIDDMRAKFEAYIAVSIGLVTLVTTLLAALVAGRKGSAFELAPFMGAATLGLAVMALGLSAVSFWEKTLARLLQARWNSLGGPSSVDFRKELRGHWFLVGAIAAVALGAGTLVWWKTWPFFKELEARHFATQEEVRGRDASLTATLREESARIDRLETTAQDRNAGLMQGQVPAARGHAGATAQEK